MGLGTELLIRTIAVVAITDLLMAYVIMSGRSKLTWLFVVEVIIVTIVPIAIGYWWVLRKYGLNW